MPKHFLQPLPSILAAREKEGDHMLEPFGRHPGSESPRAFRVSFLADLPPQLGHLHPRVEPLPAVASGQAARPAFEKRFPSSNRYD